MFASLVAALALMGHDPAIQQQAQQPAPDPSRAVELEDVVVTGSSLENLINRFVGEVAQPGHHRGLARWRHGVCVGVANLQRDTAEALADQVSRTAMDLGLTPGDPGCNPNILVVATTDANSFTPAFVDRRARLFRVGGAGMDAGGTAFRKFLNNDQPVRWWAVSMPVDSATGSRAVRIPGADFSINESGDTVYNYAPTTRIASPSLMRTQIVDDMGRVFVILDMDKIQGVNTQQLGDYIAMVSLAQIDPEADTSQYASILNLFDEPDTAGLTQWDRAYLGGLYASERVMSNANSHRAEIAAEVQREHGRLRTGEN